MSEDGDVRAYSLCELFAFFDSDVEEVGEDGAWVLHHYLVESRLVDLAVDFDVVGVLLVDEAVELVNQVDVFDGQVERVAMEDLAYL